MRTYTPSSLAFITLIAGLSAVPVQAQTALSPPVFLAGGEPQGTLFGPSWVSSFDTTDTVVNSSIAMQYQFRVNGPENLTVPVNLDYFLLASSSSTNIIPHSSADFPYTHVITQSQISIGFTRTLFQDTATFESVGGIVTKNTNAYETEHASIGIVANFAYSVLLIADSSAGGYDSNHQQIAGFSATAYAFADPYLVIASDFALTNPGYSLQFSPGIVNTVSQVPEPTTTLLSVLGAAMLCIRKVMARQGLSAKTAVANANSRQPTL